MKAVIKEQRRTFSIRHIAIKVALIYAAFAAVWIALSDRVLFFLVTDPALLSTLSVYKGWGFVAITTLLLFAYLHHFGPVTAAQALTESSAKRPNSIPLLAALGLTFIVIILVGYLAYMHRQTEIRQAEAAKLTAIATLKANQIETWLQDRRANAKVMASGPFMTQETERWLTDSEEKVKDSLLERMQQFRLAYNIEGLFLVDGQGRLRLSEGAATALSPASQSLALQAMQGNQVLYSDIQSSQDKNVTNAYLEFFAPLVGGGRCREAPCGVLVVRYDLHRFLFPLIQSWPAPSATSETLLVRREGDRILYLNTLRHRPSTPLTLDQPLTNTRLPAAQVMLQPGHRGVFVGDDYRNVPVLAVSRPVQGTPWIMIAKTDLSEIDRDIRHEAVLVFALTLGAIGVASVFIGLLWRQQKAFYSLQIHQQELERRALLSHFAYLFQFANDMIFLLDENRRIVEANDSSVEAYGWSRQELLGMDVGELMGAVPHSDPQHDQREILQQSKTPYQTWHQRKNGSVFPVEVSVCGIEIETKRYTQLIVRDITERKKYEAQIERARDFYVQILDEFPNPVWRAGIDGKPNWFNRAWFEFTGRSMEQETGDGWTESVHPDDLRICLENYQRASTTRSPFLLVYRLRHHNGEYHWMFSYGKPLYDLTGGFVGYIASCYDQHDLQQTREKFAEAERFLQSTLDALPEHICVLDETGAILAVNQAWRDFALRNDADPAVLEKANYLDTCDNATGPFSEQAAAFAAGIRAVIHGTQTEFALDYSCHAPLEKNWFVGKVVRFQTKGPVRVVIAHENITERKLAEARILHLNRLYVALSQTNQAIVRIRDRTELLNEICRIAVDYAQFKFAWVGFIDADSRTVRPTATAGKNAGYLKAAEILIDADPSENSGPATTAIRRGVHFVCNDFLTDPVSSPPWRDKTQQAGVRAVAAFPIHEEGRVTGAFSVYTDQADFFDEAMIQLLDEMALDISFGLDTIAHDAQRRFMMRALQLSEARYRSIFSTMAVGWGMTDLNGHFVEVNAMAGQMLGYSQEELLAMNCLDLTHPDDRELTQQYLQRLAAGEIDHFHGEKRYLCKDGSPWWGDLTLAPYREPDGAITALIGIVIDISARKKAEEQVQHSIARLKSAMLETIQVVAQMSELRDPYTAGHERRVADLAAAIGRELGLSEHGIEGLRVIGSVHDIGKVTIPAEILSKSGKLSTLEYEVIKTHPNQGYEVMKTIMFPWPVAETIRQHHERLDGSGYPRGLQGDAILREARILAVADVVEAMASHRPYRPALGVKAALAEITRGSSLQFDADAVAACVSLFNEKGYTLLQQ